MKTRILFGGLVLVMGFSTASAQTSKEGNSKVRAVLENKSTQDMLRTLKNDPEKSIEALSRNSDDAANAAIAIFQDQIKSKDSGGVPATRSSVSQTDKGMQKLQGILNTPASSGKGVSGSDLRKQIDSGKLEELRRAASQRIDSATANQANENFEKARQAIYGSSNPAAAAVRDVIEPQRTVGSTNPAPTASPSVMQNEGIANRQAATVPRDMKPTVPQIPDSPELSGAAPAPRPIQPRYPKPEKFRAIPQQSTEADSMVIESGEAEMDEKNHILTFRHDVIVEMKDMQMTCDTLVVYLDSKNQEMLKTVASGGMVEIKRMGESGKLQIAKARKAVHDARTEDTILSGGPPFLQDGDRYVNTDSEHAQIVLGGDGKYRVDSGSPKEFPTRSVIVVPIGNKFKGDFKLDTKSITNGQ